MKTDKNITQHPCLIHKQYVFQHQKASQYNVNRTHTRARRQTHTRTSCLTCSVKALCFCLQ